MNPYLGPCLSHGHNKSPSYLRPIETKINRQQQSKNQSQMACAEMVTKEEVVTVLKDCYDPEIPINIWDLGLVYDINIQEGNVGIKMTLTAPGCMMGGMIADDVKAKLKALNGVKDAKVDLVFDPPWTPDKMSEEAKAQMGIA